MTQSYTPHKVCAALQRLSDQTECEKESRRHRLPPHAWQFFIDNPHFFPPGPSKQLMQEEFVKEANKINSIKNDGQFKTLLTAARLNLNAHTLILKKIASYAYDQGRFEDAAYWWHQSLLRARIQVILSDRSVLLEEPESVWGYARALFMLAARNPRIDNCYYRAAYEAMKKTAALTGILGPKVKFEVIDFHSKSLPVGYMLALQHDRPSLEKRFTVPCNSPGMEAFFMFLGTQLDSKGYKLLLAEINYQLADFHGSTPDKAKKTKTATEVLKHYSGQTEEIADLLVDSDKWPYWQNIVEHLRCALETENEGHKLLARYALTRRQSLQPHLVELQAEWAARLKSTMAELRSHGNLKQLVRILNEREKSEEPEALARFVEDILTLSVAQDVKNEKVIIHRKVRAFCEQKLKEYTLKKLQAQTRTF